MNKATKHLIVVTLVTILVFAQAIVALANYVIVQENHPDLSIAPMLVAAGQSFTTGRGGYITQIDVFVVTPPSGTWEGRVYSGDGFNGTPIYIQSITASGCSNCWEEIILTSPPAVDADTQYTFGLALDAGTTTVGMDFSNPYADGTAWYGVNWGAATSVPDYDVAFRIHIGEPVGGHTETARPLALLWPWLLLAAMVATGAIVAVTLKRSTA
jgi:hypothetical protein